MSVHNELGNGFQEKIYKQCIAIELGENGIQFKREVNQPIYYKNQRVGTRRADFIVEDLVMLELKAILQIEDVHLSQGLNYLTAYNLATGLLINFGAKSLQYKRLYNKNDVYSKE